VESKRGGGGYLRIRRVSPSQDNIVMHIVNSIGDRISFQTATIFVKNMVDNEYLSAREGKMILSGITDNVLSLPLPLRDTMRAAILKNMLVSIMM
ncbi:MAG: CtsR family transcriptional regulator, partial [Clostridia bacterium]|nr:CtsR family transcriptional regulator [Clostridia bacterium]